MPRWMKPNRALELQRRVSRTDDHGGDLASWTTVRTVYGRIFPLRAEERVQAAHVEGIRTHEIHVRYTDDLTHEDRLKNGAAVYHVDGVVDVDGRRRYAKVMAVEEV